MGAPKYSDDKGRITLGTAYANQTFIVVEQPNGDLILRPSVTVPANEAWLLKNAEAFGMVARGITQAKAKKFVESPEREEDQSWISKLED